MQIHVCATCVCDVTCKKDGSCRAKRAGAPPFIFGSLAAGTSFGRLVPCTPAEPIRLSGGMYCRRLGHVLVVHEIGFMLIMHVAVRSGVRGRCGGKTGSSHHYIAQHLGEQMDCAIFFPIPAPSSHTLFPHAHRFSSPHTSLHHALLSASFSSASFLLQHLP